MEEYIYVFIGEESNVPSGVFSSYDKGEKWIKDNLLNGSLNELPLDISVYQWAIDKEYFEPKKEYQKEARFIQRFTSASINHWHFENGTLC